MQILTHKFKILTKFLLVGNDSGLKTAFFKMN